MEVKNNSKRISLFSATALSATCMIGSGWLFSAQLAAHYAGNWAFLAWILAGLFAVMVGICLAEIVSIYPVSGVTTRSSSLSHNNTFGMPFAFSNWFGVMVTVATEAQATAQYISAASKDALLMNNGVLTFYGKALAIFILAIYLIINFYGVKLLSRVNNVVTVLKIFTPILAIVILLIAHFDTTNFSLATNSIYGPGSAITALISAGLIYSFNGFQTSVSFASEIENPKRNVLLSMILSIIIVTIVYMLLELAFMGAVPNSMLAGGWTSLNFSSPLVNLTMLLGLNFLYMVLLADSIVSPSGAGYSYLGSASRMLYAMAAEGQMPKWLAKMTPGHGFSRRSLILNFILTAIVLTQADSWAALMVVVTGFNIIGYMAAPVSMGAIKPKTRIFGAIAFVIISLLMGTIPTHDMYLINGSMSAIMFVFLLIQIKKMPIRKMGIMVLPFLVYLWAFIVIQNTIGIIIFSLIFYIMITSRKYVEYCVAERNLEIKHGDYSDIDEVVEVVKSKV